MWDALWIDVRLATMDPRLCDSTDSYGTLLDAALAVEDGRIVWVGPRSRLPGPPQGLAAEVHEVAGRWMTPGLIDCHTHLVFDGNRSWEFNDRMNGSRHEVAVPGHGIRNTAEATRAAGYEDLCKRSRRRLDRLRAEGVTTVEIKSGYGLDTDTEIKQLRAARQLARETGIRVRRTLLALHALPLEQQDDPDGYLDLVCRELLPRVDSESLAEAVDAYLDTPEFSLDHVEGYFAAARACGLPVKLHADQLANRGAAALAARWDALSADHLEHTDEAGVTAMAAAGTVAVLLPGTYYFLGLTRPPPVALLRRHGVPMALATDCNPGSSPVTSLLLMLNMGCVLFGLRPEEALAGVTRHAARALGLQDECGRLVPGLCADLVVWDIDHPAELAYRMGDNPAKHVVVRGNAVQF